MLKQVQHDKLAYFVKNFEQLLIVCHQSSIIGSVLI